MTSRERLLTAIKRGKPDRVPVAPWGFGALNPQSDLVKELLAKTDPFISVSIGNPFGNANAEYEVRKEGNDTVTILHTPHGDLVERLRKSEVASCRVEFLCKNADDVHKYLSIPFKPVEPNLDRFHAWRAEVKDEALVVAGTMNAVCLPATILSPEDFCLLWADEPDLMIELTKVAFERLMIFTEKACRLGVDVFRIIGGEYVTEQLGPAAVDKLLVPFDTEQIKLMHEYGVIAHYHNHGNMMPFLDALAGLGIDSLDPLEGPPFGDVLLREAKERLRGRVCLVGNLDDMEVLGKLPEEEIRKLGRERIEEAGPDGFILGGTSSGTFTEQAARNFIALVEVAKEMAG
ncbi:MAG TPA: hypothetical protein GXX29_04140 [Firmicutes bacterium]|nr:hypothetical protein [Bacillota bacterium]